jgi:hypothetical protein
VGCPIWFSPFGLEELVPSTPRGTKGELDAVLSLSKEGVVVIHFLFPFPKRKGIKGMVAPTENKV